MSTTGLPTIWELVAEGSAALPEPFTRAALINWISARRPDVGVSSIAAHIQFATANAGTTGHANPFAGREPLLHRVERGRYLRYRASAPDSSGPAVPSGRVVLIGSSGATATGPLPAAQLFESAGFVRAREHAAGSGHPWFVVTAKHGLLDPDDVVAPFDIQLGDRSMGYRAAWGEWVVAQLGDRLLLDGVTVEVHGGVDFAQPLRHPLIRRGASLDLQLPGTWQEHGRGAENLRDGSDSSGWEVPAPIRAPLGRLRDLVAGHRHPLAAARGRVSRS
jgi:hypothetical protein